MTRPYHSGDIDDLHGLLEHPGWALVKERLEGNLKGRRNELERSADIEVTEFTRGFIRALRIVLALPATMIESITEELKAKPKP